MKVTACDLFGAKPYLNQWWFIVICTLRNKIQWNMNKDTTFIHKIAFENFVYKMLAI